MGALCGQVRLAAMRTVNWLLTVIGGHKNHAHPTKLPHPGADSEEAGPRAGSETRK